MKRLTGSDERVHGSDLRKPVNAWRWVPWPALVTAMAGFDDPAFYGDRWAPVYDDHHAADGPGACCGFPRRLAGDARVLELAIGTGRVALPLAARGIAVEGVDASAAMVERLRAKPGGESIPVVIGDMAQVTATGPFRLVYLVFNSLFGLLSQARQAECFATSPACSARAGCSSSSVSSPTWSVRPGPACPGTSGDRGLRHPGGVPPRRGATARHHPNRHAAMGRAPTCGRWPCATPGPANWT